MPTPLPLLMCEFHDARARTVTLDNSGSCTFHFDSLSCYYPSVEMEQMADVWATEGILEFANFDHIDISLPSTHDLWIGDAEFAYDPPLPEDPYNLSLLTGRQLRRASILLCNGGRITIDGGTATLAIRARHERIDSCEWPL